MTAYTVYLDIYSNSRIPYSEYKYLSKMYLEAVYSSNTCLPVSAYRSARGRKDHIIWISTEDSKILALKGLEIGAVKIVGRPIEENYLESGFGSVLEYCRHVNGSIVQPWIILPSPWVTWTLQTKAQETTTSPVPNPSEINVKTLEAILPSQDLQASTHVTHFSSSPEVERIFCGECGTGFTYLCSGEDPNMTEVDKKLGPIFDISMGTLDEEFLALDWMQPIRES